MSFLKIIIMILALCLINNLGYSQKKVFLEIGSGISLSDRKVSNMTDSYFKSGTISSLANTGIKVKIETLNNLYLGFGYYLQNFASEDIEYSQQNIAGWGSKRKCLATNFSLSVKYHISILKKFNFSPFVGFSVANLDLPSYYTSPGSFDNWGTIISGTSIIKDSTFIVNHYNDNKIIFKEIGTEVSIKLHERLSVFVEFTYLLNKKYYMGQTVTYYMTGQNPESAQISYGGNFSMFRIGLNWHLVNLVKPNSNKVKIK